jgi:hypothetical protein
MYVDICISKFVYPFLCRVHGRKRKILKLHTYIRIHMYLHTFIFIYIYKHMLIGSMGEKGKY